MRYLSKISTSPRFKLLVAHHKRASDPSRGEEGNPQPIRNGFVGQTIVSQHGHAQLGRFLEKKIKLSIQINSLDFFNARIAQTPPFFDTDEILAYASRINVLDELPALKAGDDFGQDAGGGVGDIPTVASQLAKSLSEKNLGILATVDAVDNTLVNIAEKNPFYGEYTFYYWYWKNSLKFKKKDEWVGFCSYRELWGQHKNIKDKKSIKSLLKDKPEEWEKYEAIIGEPTFLERPKIMKLLKHGKIAMIRNFKEFIWKRHVTSASKNRFRYKCSWFPSKFRKFLTN
mgnify:CR=1 FL=1